MRFWRNDIFLAWLEWNLIRFLTFFACNFFLLVRMKISHNEINFAEKWIYSTCIKWTCFLLWNWEATILRNYAQWIYIRGNIFKRKIMFLDYQNKIDNIWNVSIKQMIRKWFTSKKNSIKFKILLTGLILW